jgi:hypothetical protein
MNDEEKSLAVAMSLSTAQDEAQDRQDLALAIALSASLTGADVEEVDAQTNSCAEAMETSLCINAVATATWILKVTLGDDTRRLQTSWASDATPQQALESIVNAVEEGFGSSVVMSSFVFRYADEDGDMCSVVQSTIQDCLSFAQNNVLKLVVAPRSGSSMDSAEQDLHSDGQTLTRGAQSSPFTLPADVPTIVDEYEQEWSIVEPNAGCEGTWSSDDAPEQV